jgi:hypothetical protein
MSLLAALREVLLILVPLLLLALINEFDAPEAEPGARGRS